MHVLVAVYCQKLACKWWLKVINKWHPWNRKTIFEQPAWKAKVNAWTVGTYEEHLKKSHPRSWKKFLHSIKIITLLMYKSLHLHSRRLTKWTFQEVGISTYVVITVNHWFRDGHNNFGGCTLDNIIPMMWQTWQNNGKVTSFGQGNVPLSVGKQKNDINITWTSSAGKQKHRTPSFGHRSWNLT